MTCAQDAEQSLEADLFGQEVVTLSGAVRPHRGWLEETAGGTLYLDEVAALELPLQVRLLRALERRAFRRVGGSQDIPLQVRIIASTRRDLRAAVRAGSFREDLAWRLNVLSHELLPLRLRAAELNDLARALLDEIASYYGRAAPRLDPDAERVLQSYDWPGNLRELRNVLERAWLGVGSEITAGRLASALAGVRESHPCAPGRESSPSAPPPDAVDNNAGGLAAQERSLIERVLTETRYNMRRAATVLGISRSTLYLRARQYGIDVSRARRTTDG